MLLNDKYNGYIDVGYITYSIYILSYITLFSAVLVMSCNTDTLCNMNYTHVYP